MFKVGVTGGIGSGKSTLCRKFAERGIAVYDSDSRAKALMAEQLREELVGRFGGEVFEGGRLNRQWLAARVFSDPAELEALNAIVHPAVMADFRAWAERQECRYVILESAILFDAGLEGEVDRSVAVLAPLSLRVERTCRRDGCDEEAVRRRIAAQMDDDTLRDRADYAVVNVFEEDLDAAVELLDKRFCHEDDHADRDA